MPNKDYLLDLAHHVEGEALFGSEELDTSLLITQTDWDDLGQPERVIVSVEPPDVEADLISLPDSETLDIEISQVVLSLLTALDSKDTEAVLNIVTSLDDEAQQKTLIFFVGIAHELFSVIADSNEVTMEWMLQAYGQYIMQQEMQRRSSSEE